MLTFSYRLAQVSTGEMSAQDLGAAENGSGEKKQEAGGKAGDAVEIKRHWLFRALFGATPIIILFTLLLAALVAMTVGLLVHYYDKPEDSSTSSPRRCLDIQGFECLNKY